MAGVYRCCICGILLCEHDPQDCPLFCPRCGSHFQTDRCEQLSQGQLERTNKKREEGAPDGQGLPE